MIRRQQSSFTRPNDVTAYADGDLVANSTTAGSVVPMDFGGYGASCEIVRAVIRKSGVSTANAAFRLHLFASGTITAANGDNGAFSTSAAASYLGAFDVTVGRAFTDGAVGVGVPQSGQGNSILAPGSILYGLLEAKGAYTPAAQEFFTVSLEIKE